MVVIPFQLRIERGGKALILERAHIMVFLEQLPERFSGGSLLKTVPVDLSTY